VSLASQLARGQVEQTFRTLASHSISPPVIPTVSVVSRLVCELEHRSPPLPISFFISQRSREVSQPVCLVSLSVRGMNTGSPPLPVSPFITQPMSLHSQLVRVSLVSQAIYEVNTSSSFDFESVYQPASKYSL